jgi:hypothetical protein
MAIAIDSNDAMDEILEYLLAVRPIFTARSSLMTSTTLAACGGDAAEKSDAD